MISASASASSRNRSPFTATQWQELEHQALIFKYMVSGVPIPPDLIYTVKRSLDASSFSSRLFSHHPGGWGCFEMGFGRKVDPEPGRCRRTDGKKWRCSKEAYPDSKYCERHMHRGRNRSRKHVEVSSSSSSSSSTTTTTTATTAVSSGIPTAISAYTHAHHQIIPSSFMSDQTTPLYPPYAYADSSSSAAASPYFCLKSATDKDYRYFHGAKESGMDELAFFPEAASNTCHALTGYNSSRGGYAQAQYQALADASKEPVKHHHPAEDQRHCFVLGTDFKSDKASVKDQSDTQKPLHHFFGEWPPKNTAADSWLDLASNSRLPNDG